MAESASSARRQHLRSCGPCPRGATVRHGFGDGARDRGASCADDQLERLAVGTRSDVGMSAKAKLEDAAECVDHVRPRLFTRSALAIRARDLRNRCDDPAVVAAFVHDRDL